MSCNVSACNLCAKASNRKHLRLVSKKIMESYAPGRDSNSSISPNALATDSNNNDSILICAQCRSNITGKVKCVACDDMKLKHRTISFRREKYCKNRLADTIEHASECDQICRVCDKRLMHTYMCTCCHNKFDKNSCYLMFRNITFQIT